MYIYSVGMYMRRSIDSVLSVDKYDSEFTVINEARFGEYVEYETYN